MKISSLTVCGSHMSLFMTVMISPFSHTIVYIDATWLYILGKISPGSSSRNPLLNCLGGWIKSGLRANTAVFGCPALKMFAPLLPGSIVSALGGMCIHMCTNPDKCKPSGHSIGQYGDDGHSGTTKVAILLLNLLHV